MVAEGAVAADPARAIAGLATDAADCRRCPLYRNATQVVFGEGDARSEIMLVGEQPGDQEDRIGRPFVGPAGRLLDTALATAGLDRSALYLTNAVKHFKNEPRGKKRLHRRPDRYEVDRCRWWLDRELRIVNPSLVVALGATAAHALVGRAVNIGRERNTLMTFADGRQGLVTIHPSAILRLREPEERKEAMALLVRDLEHVRDIAGGLAGTKRRSRQ